MVHAESQNSMGEFHLQRKNQQNDWGGYRPLSPHRARIRANIEKGRSVDVTVLIGFDMILIGFKYDVYGFLNVGFI